MQEWRQTEADPMLLVFVLLLLLLEFVEQACVCAGKEEVCPGKIRMTLLCHSCWT